jgi:outer membrane protein OmpA-like peptidoglycan-associated protein
MKKYSLLFLLLPMFFYSQEKLDVYFDFDKYDLNEQGVKKINSWIAEGKNYEVTKLYGFCDWKGTNQYNDTLAMKRVYTVYDFLKLSKIDVKKEIEIRGFGEDFLQSEVQDENRRVTIIFQEKKEIPVVVTSEQKLKDKVKGSKVGDLIRLPNFYFFNNSAKIVPKSQPILYDLLCLMNDNPKLKIEIQGHICCKLPSDIDAVSTARARAIFNFLVVNKIDRKRLSFKGYGVTRPIHPIPEKNTQEEDDNRRVEIMIVAN